MTRPARLPIEKLQPFLLDVPHPRYVRPEQLPVNPPLIDWASTFGSRSPVEIEVGFGKGTFLVESAAARPEANFLGIEIERKYVMSTAARLARHEIPNAKLVCTDARWFLRTYVADRSIRAIHVYFPDPWWKTRHKKRLLFTPEFAAQARRVLEPTGQLLFATDVEEYYQQTLTLVHALGELAMLPANPGPTIQTNFERKYRAEGRPIYRAHFVLGPAR